MMTVCLGKYDVLYNKGIFNANLKNFPDRKNNRMNDVRAV
jgi:hypothetical protein